MAPARRLAFFSAAILAALAAVLPSGIASAAGRPAAETRVWAFSSAAQPRIGADRLVSADQRLGQAVSCPFYAPGACAAPEGGSAVIRTFRSGDAAGAGDASGTYAGPPLTVEQARAAAESYGFDTSNMELRYVSPNDPYYLPDKYGWTHFSGADKPILTPEGNTITDLTDLALGSPQEAAMTIGHELYHIIFQDPYNHAAAEQWARAQMGL